MGDQVKKAGLAARQTDSLTKDLSGRAFDRVQVHQILRAQAEPILESMRQMGVIIKSERPSDRPNILVGPRKVEDAGISNI